LTSYIIIIIFLKCSWVVTQCSGHFTYAPAFLSFYKYWPDDGLARPKLVANI